MRCASPGAQRPSASRLMSWFALKQSWSSQRWICCAVRFAWARAVAAARWVMEYPIREMDDLSKRLGESVARAWPAMRIAWCLRWGRASRKAWETMIAAAPPSDVGQHWSLVSGGKTAGDWRICSSV